MDHLASHELIRLVSLSGNQDDVPLPRAFHGFADGLRAVGNHSIILVPCRLDAGLDFIEDLHGIFVSRIVARDEYLIAQAAGRDAHWAPLGPVAISSATEYGDDPPVREPPKGFQNILQGAVRMRVIDKDV